MLEDTEKTETETAGSVSEVNNQTETGAAPQEATPRATATLLPTIDITVTYKPEEADKESSSMGFSSSRNFTKIGEVLEAVKNIEKVDNVKLEANFSDASKQIMAEGKYEDILAFVRGNMLSGEQALALIKQLCVRLVETSDLKFAIFTLCFEGPRLGGVGIRNETLETTSQEAKAFLNGAAGQLDMFAKEMEKTYPELAPEKSRIIIPGK